ncbi:helix-turn-helix domain-containing protein [Natronomonas halophila]|uniref:helix-turn-helix domain-containing protein n=1 Tax=Natronomonas halophila TaxID=2747817 RepID=UPI0015B549D1|nr:helix-turn-helix domain-containing protein [Natronomonas halophila]QLD84950.1 helix-turn-helix domain-containing protein [Natronomonas halophila]
MRYFDLVLTPEHNGIHPVDAQLATIEGLERDSLLHIDAFGDGTGVLLYRLVGDKDAVVGVIEDHEDVISYDILDVEAEDTFHLYLHVHPGEPAGTLMALCYEFALIIDTPIEFTDRGGVLVTIVGTHDMLREALKAVPDHINISIQQVGQYSPGTRDMLSMLTERQREVFETAVEMGYYDIPRQVNQGELADRLDCAPSTVDEHLRKAESKMLSALLRNTGAETDERHASN